MMDQALNPLSARNSPSNGIAVSEFQRFLQHVSEKDLPDGSWTLKAWVDLAETWRITRALEASGGNRSAAARTLGIGRRTLYAKMEKLGITPSWGL